MATSRRRRHVVKGQFRYVLETWLILLASVYFADMQVDRWRPKKPMEPISLPVEIVPVVPDMPLYEQRTERRV